jgi:hypothetical protein
MTLRKTITYPKSWYLDVLEAYKVIKGVELRGTEHQPLLQACKTMFMNGRLPKDIIACMDMINGLYPDWTLKTVSMKLPDFLAGKMKSETLKMWFYENQRAYMKQGMIYIICSDGEHREYNDTVKKLECRVKEINRDKTDAEEQMEIYMSKIK